MNAIGGMSRLRFGLLALGIFAAATAWAWAWANPVDDRRLIGEQTDGPPVVVPDPTYPRVLR